MSVTISSVQKCQSTQKVLKMGVESIETRVENAVKSKSDFDWRSLLSDLRDSMNKCDENVRRGIIQIAVLIAIFLLLSGAAVEEVSIFGLKISNYELLVKLIPVVIAYRIYSFISSAMYGNLLELFHQQIVRRAFPHLWENDIEDFLLFPQHFHTETILSTLGGHKLAPFLEKFALFQGWVIMGTPPIVVIWLIWENISAFGLDWVVGLSGIVSIFLIIHSLALIINTRSVYWR